MERHRACDAEIPRSDLFGVYLVWWEGSSPCSRIRLAGPESGESQGSHFRTLGLPPASADIALVCDPSCFLYDVLM